MTNKHLKNKIKSIQLNPIMATIRDAINDKKFQGIALSALMVGGIAVMPGANAQVVDTAQTETADKETSQGIETITVTSRKRVENIQDTPLSITALGATKLDELGIENFDDYALMLPSLSYQSAGPGLSQVYMRGASDGGSGNASGSQPSVAIYLDEQPVTAIGRNLDLHIYDIERVEALAGPQSTLFGASSQSGTIRIITNKPQVDTFEGGVDVSYGKTKSGDASHSLEGFMNLPVSDNAAIRLVAWTKKDGGYIDNIAGTRTYGLFTDGGNFSTVEENNDDLIKENFNELTNSGARVALKVNLNDDWIATASYLTQKQETEGVWFQDSENPSGEVGDLEVQRYFPDSMDDEFSQAALTIEGNFGSSSLVYAGSFMDRDVQYFNDYSDYADYFSTSWIQYYGCEYYGTADVDVDCSSMAIFYNDDNQYKRNTHELRLQSTDNAPLQYIVGLYYEDASHDYRQEWIMDGMAQGADFRQFGVSNLWYLTDQKRADKQSALFGEVSYAFTEQLTTTLGARWFENESKLVGVSGYGLIAPGFPIINVDSKDEDSDSIFKFNLTYKIDDKKMVYLTWSEGYRPGGINRDETDLVARIYKSDFVTNTELGWKTMWLDNNLRWNGAIYHMQWDDMQFTRFDSSYGSPVGLTVNASEAKIVGIESDITYLMTPDWTVTAAFNFNQAELAADLLVGSNLSPEGTALPNVPDFKGNLTSRYNVVIGGYNSFAQIVYSYVGESYSDIYKYKTGDVNLDLRDVNNSYSIVNLSAGIDMDGWGVNMYVDNLTDERAQLSRGGASYDSTVTVNRPRNVGIRFHMLFE
ncbi:MAG: iron complex outermembrane receptor protein [Candidatus Azotimanducaceae bacterium]|jgi:iron complex outermembrane receptor protein